jgi:glycosyltransferase involved in cell wall biosynthesis
MAHGLPTLATADSETAAVLARHDCGASVTCETDAVARALVDLLLDRERYRRLSANALAAAAGYRWEQLMEREYQILARAWARRGAPCTS